MSVTFQTMMSVPSGFTKCPSLFTFRCLSTLYFKMSVTFYLQTSVPPSDKKCLLSKPKLNQNLSSIEFEVRLHSYSDIHPTTPPGTHHVVVVVNWPGRAGQAECTIVQSHTGQCKSALHIWASNFLIRKSMGLWKFLAQNPKILWLRANLVQFFFKITLEGKKRSRGQV